MIYMNLQMVLNTQNNPYLNQAAQKILAKILLPKQILKSKSFDHPYHMKSGENNPTPPPPTPHSPLAAPGGLERASQRLRIFNCILNVLESDSR